MYLDPGFGGMLLQGIVVIVAMGGAILFLIRKKISNLFSKKNRTNSDINTSSNRTNNVRKDGAIDASTDTDLIDALEESEENK